jgi:hypothetical protein
LALLQRLAPREPPLPSSQRDGLHRGLRQDPSARPLVERRCHLHARRALWPVLRAVPPSACAHTTTATLGCRRPRLPAQSRTSQRPAQRRIRASAQPRPAAWPPSKRPVVWRRASAQEWASIGDRLRPGVTSIVGRQRRLFSWGIGKRMERRWKSLSLQ